MTESETDNPMKIRLRLPAKNLEAEKNKQRRFRIGQFDQQIIDLNNRKYLPTKIADLLCCEHDLDPRFLNRKTVERRLRYLKQKGLAKLAPVNIEMPSQATNVPRTWRGAAAALANQLSSVESEPEVMAIEAPPPAKSDQQKKEEENEIVVVHFQDAGMLYCHEGEDVWSLFIARSLCSWITVSDLEENGVTIHWEAQGPTDQEIAFVSQITKAQVHEFNFGKTRSSLFVTSPRLLSRDQSKVKSTFCPSSDHPRWLVLSIPFQSGTSRVIAELPPFE